MLKSRSLLVVLLLVVALIASVSIAAAVTPASDTPVQPPDSSATLSADDPWSQAERIDTMETSTGNILWILSDGEYLYYVSPSDGSLVSMILEDTPSEEIVLSYDTQSSSTISTAEAEEILLTVLATYFPEYDLNSLVISASDLSASPLEYFRFQIEEIVDQTRVNIAAVSLSFTGTLVSLSGTHYTLADFNAGTSSASGTLISQEDLASIASEFLSAENAALTESTGESSSDLPAYTLYVENGSDIYYPQAIRVMYNGNVCWEYQFYVKSSWGEIDVIFNPLLTLYIDASTGEVADYLMTDGGLLES